MPVYPGQAGSFVPVASNASPIALQKGESVYLFGKPSAAATQLPVTDAQLTQETIVAGTASIAVVLTGQAGDPPPTVNVELRFSAAPGAFELDIQEAETDADGFYLLPGSAVNINSALFKITAVNATTFVARADIPFPVGKFLRALMLTLTNAVNTSLKLTRTA